MNSNRLDFLIRRNKGRSLLDSYMKMFISAGFREKELKSIDLETSDRLIEQVKIVFPNIPSSLEILREDSIYLDSKLLMEAFNTTDDNSSCYIFSDDFFYCGMYMTNTKSVLERCLNVAKDGYSNTCFILDENMGFYFTINFYHEGQGELYRKFDVQFKSHNIKPR